VLAEAGADAAGIGQQLGACIGENFQGTFALGRLLVTQARARSWWRMVVVQTARVAGADRHQHGVEILGEEVVVGTHADHRQVARAARR